jgi:ABC-2 type transport system permease protein
VTWRRTWAVARKEALHIRRDLRSLILALLLPLILLALFGYALTLDVDRIPVFVYDASQSPESRGLISRFEGSRYFSVLGHVEDAAALEMKIRRDECLLGISIPRDYAVEVLAGREAAVQFLVDGADSNTASIALGYVDALIRTYAADVQASAQVRKTGRRAAPPVELRTRVWYNSDLKSRNFIVPGLIAVVLMIISALLTSLTIAREWENGTMEQLLSTPLRPAEMVLGKLMAFFALGLTDVTVAVLAGVFVFGVPLRGSALFLFFTSCVFMFGALGWGILLSAVTRSQLLAYQAGLVTSFLPAFLLSGLTFAIENMPPAVRAITYAFPSRYFVGILKGVFLKGAGIEVLGMEVLFLAVYGLAVVSIAVAVLGRKLA